MKNVYFFYRPFNLGVLIILLAGAEAKSQQVQGNWTGTIRKHEKAKTSTGWSEKTITVTILNNRGTGTIRYEDEIVIEGKSMGKGDCQGDGEVELMSVSLNPYDSTYEIATIGPTCSSGSNPWGYGHGNDINILDQKFTNSGILSGSESKTIDIPPDLGTATITTTWHLVRVVPKVELIITPSDYDNWLPEPGKDEMTKGSVMNIDLTLQTQGGGTPSLKAISFELRLLRTSSEPGITINAPLTPLSTLPDIRFLPQGTSYPGDNFQRLEIPCRNCTSVSAEVAAYDGGGWTTLIAEATLEDNSKVKGMLLTSGGSNEVPIPKRSPGSNIARSWLASNNNPNENDDIESSTGNTNDGDGLTAYEEYRGVISEGSFKRLDPMKKEVGVKMKKSEMPFFDAGIIKFENASGLKVIRFAENEIGADRKLDKNFKTAHVYDQYALFLQKGVLTPDLGKSFGGPGIPKQISKTVIAENNIRQAYQDRIAEANSMNAQIAYSLLDMFATVTAHELAHSVNVKHHGSLAPNSMNLQVQQGRPVRIFSHNGSEILTRPYSITGRGGDKGNEQSGDISCFMVNNALCDWAVTTTPDSVFFYEVPPIPLGTLLCTKKDGTGLNQKDANSNNNYFGDAANGNCLSQIKLK